MSGRGDTNMDHGGSAGDDGEYYDDGGEYYDDDGEYEDGGEYTEEAGGYEDEGGGDEAYGDDEAPYAEDGEYEYDDAGGEAAYEEGEYDEEGYVDEGDGYDDGDAEYGGGDYDDEGADSGADGYGDESDKVIKEGYLFKANPSGKRWNKRWVVLTYTTVTYYTSAEKLEKHKKKSFSLEGSELREGWGLDREPKTPYLFTIDVPAPLDRAFYFCCADDEELGEWLDSVGLALGYEDEDEADDDGEGEYDEAADMDEGDVDEAEYDGGEYDGGEYDEAEEGEGEEGEQALDEDLADELDGGGAADDPLTVVDDRTGDDGVSADGETVGADDETAGDGASAGRVARDYAPSGGGTDGDSAAAPVGGEEDAVSHDAGSHGRRGRGDDGALEESTRTATREGGAGQPVSEHGDGDDARGSMHAEPRGRDAHSGGHAAPSVPAPAGQVKFTVTNSITGQVYIIVSPEEKAEVMTVKKIKRRITKHAKARIAAADMVLSIGDDVLQDAWTGKDFGLVDGTRITLSVRSADPQPLAASKASEAKADEAKVDKVPALSPQGGHGKQAPSPQGGHGKQARRAGDTATVTTSQPAAVTGDTRQTAAAAAVAAATPAPTESSGTVAVATASPSARAPTQSNGTQLPASGVMKRIERRMALRRVFQTLSADDVTADAHEFYNALIATAESREHVAGTAALAALKEREPGSRITWVGFSKMLRAEGGGARFGTPPAGAGAGAGAGRVSDAAPSGGGAATSDIASPTTDSRIGGAEQPPGQQASQVLMTVALDDVGTTAEIRVQVGDDPLQLATNFVAQHGLAPDCMDHLLQEVQTTLLEAYALELRKVSLERDAEAARNAKLREVSSIPATSRSVGAPTVSRMAVQLADAEQARAEAERRAGDMEAELRRVRAELSVSQRLATAGLKSQQMATDEAGELALARRQLEHANATIRRLEARINSVSEQLASKEKELQASTFDRFVAAAEQKQRPAATAPSASAALDAEFSAADANHDGTLSRDEYRAWARQKAAILSKANNDRLKLLKENQRLRAMLGPESQSDKLEGRFRRLDEEKVKLEVEVDSLKTTTSKLQAELKSVYRRWEQDGHRWGVERRRLRDQLKAHANAAAALVVSPASGPQAVQAAVGATSATDELAQARHTIARLTQERDLILKNWSEETEILVTIWKQDKAVWAAEKQKLVHRTIGAER